MMSSNIYWRNEPLVLISPFLLQESGKSNEPLKIISPLSLGESGKDRNELHEVISPVLIWELGNAANEAFFFIWVPLLLSGNKANELF